ncbi:cytochrome P450 [Mycolicibacterium iranicum]|uniref:Cytochrome P450 n=1 Tax=Mycolicibacterium iranicum TaxID=912594 RepID=A0ABT4HEG7_MYCIR|nr:cytochrome P450 [Mycolicibacterium iranicum]MCZ0728373.1 cytochrome P450 [Mycolicibacterium iranicum]
MTDQLDNLTPAEVWAEAMKYENRANPYPLFAELRKTPVVQVTDNIYVVTGYQELLALAHDPRISSDIARSPIANRAGNQAPADGAEDIEAYGKAKTIITSDPPDHDRARRQVMRHFAPPHSPDVIPSMEPAIVKLCNDMLDKAKASGGNRIDVVDEYAYPVPVAVICKILGVPLKDEPTFHRWVFDFMAGNDMGPEAATEEGQARAKKGQEATAALRQYLANLIGGYVKEPGEGLLSKLVNDHDGPDGAMSPEEASVNAMLLLVAGHDSTVNTISNCIMTLLRSPGSFELLRDRPQLIPGAIEEVQRMQAAVQFFPSRSATADIEIGGTVIPKGAAVHLVYGAANRDPSRFTDPDRFDPERPRNEHFGWGSGIHTCMGGPLARLEVNLALETFLRRVHNPRLVTDPPPYRRNQVFRGPQHLWVEFDSISD